MNRDADREAVGDYVGDAALEFLPRSSSFNGTPEWRLKC